MIKLIIVSGYFNPLHMGHIRLLESAKSIGDKVLVIINNDIQQIIKYGKIIMSETERMEVVKAMRYVDEVILSIDEDTTVSRTLENVINKYPRFKIIFANGGDRKSKADVPETSVCDRFGIEMRFDVGGTEKLNSSSNINRLRGIE